MAKSKKAAPKKAAIKNAKEGSDLFHNIMAAAVKGNPAPAKKADKKK